MEDLGLIGDCAFLCAGIDLARADGQLWIVMSVEDATESGARLCAIRADRTTVSGITLEALPLYLREQNAIRAATGVPLIDVDVLIENVRRMPVVKSVD
jgi:hypothetical protein